MIVNEDGIQIIQMELTDDEALDIGMMQNHLRIVSEIHEQSQEYKEYQKNVNILSMYFLLNTDEETRKELWYMPLWKLESWMKIFFDFSLKLER